MERDDYEEMDRQKDEILQRQDEGIIGPYVKRIQELESRLEAASQDMRNNETLIHWKRECESLRNKLYDAEKIIDSAIDEFCTSQNEYDERTCRDRYPQYSTFKGMEILNWCAHCNAEAYQAKYPKDGK